MRLELKRVECGEHCTIGQLSVDGLFECWTLEDVVRPASVKVYGQTAIPPGTYLVDITWSPRFKQSMPILLGVKGFVGIRIHPGNIADDTEGCILVGQGRGTNTIKDSRAAYRALFAKLKAAKAGGQRITVEIT